MEKKGVSGFKGLIFSKSIVLLLRVLVAFIFIYSGVVKFLDLHQFAQVIKNYHILPVFLELPFASLIVSSEVVLGMLFLLGIYEKETGVLLISLNIVFIVAMLSAMFQGINTSCGCFAKEGDIIGVKDIVRDFIFIIMILFVLVGGEHGKANS